MAKHVAEIYWERGGSTFTDNRYSRGHRWSFDGGAVVDASSSPEVVRVPFSNPAGVDPEEALVAAISSCHMLVFLSLAARAGFVVDSYEDSAVGEMDKNAAGKSWVARVVLHPHITFSGAKIPTEEALEQLHHASHEDCFIAHSVLTAISVEGTWTHEGLSVPR